MPRLALPLVLLSLVVEFVLMFVFSKQYAKLACFLFVRREAPLVPRAPSAAGYRDLVAQPWTIPELGLEGLRYEDDESLGMWEGGTGWLRMKYKFLGWNRTMGVVCIVPNVAGDTLRLETRVLPGFALSMFPIALMMPDVRFALALLVGASVGLVVGLFMLRQRVRASLSHFLDSIESRAQQTAVRRQGR